MQEKNNQLDVLTVIGLGKIGLTLAAVFANNGWMVLGADKNPQVVDAVNSGRSHIGNEPGLNELVQTASQTNMLTATTDTISAVRQSSIVLVIVPVLIDEQNHVDYRYIDSAVEEIGKGIQKDTLVIFETTLPTGDTRSRFGKRIEEISGLKMGADFQLAYSPERVYSNRIIEDLRSYPKVVGGLDDASLERASDFYRRAAGCEIIQVSSLETAEFSKVAECVYRDVNIALANDLARYADVKGVNMPEVIQAANSQPYSHLHFPGIGVGGHCIPVYPYFFIDRGLQEGIVQQARRINDSMAAYVLNHLDEAGISQGKVLILGLSYRENVKETFRSASLLLIKQLKEKGAEVYVNDPQFSSEEIEGYGVSAFSLSSEDKNQFDAIILQAFHDEYRSLSFADFSGCKLVLDGRNALSRQEIEKAGIVYKGIGNGK